jgi:hypothetical protein
VFTFQYPLRKGVFWVISSGQNLEKALRKRGFSALFASAEIRAFGFENLDYFEGKVF